MDQGVPEIIRNQLQNDAVHEGDSVTYVELAMSAMTYEHGNEHQKKLLRDKYDSAYLAHAITLDQWGRLYNLLGGTDPDAPLQQPPPDRSVYPTAQTKLNQSHGIY